MLKCYLKFEAISSSINHSSIKSDPFLLILSKKEKIQTKFYIFSHGADIQKRLAAQQ